MTVDPLFTAAPLVEFLRGQLWRAKPGRAAGRASVMIGAGFSLNADPSTSAARPFPTWQGLTKGLARDVDWPGGGTGDPMRVAQEYEATFGRARLDEAIRALVPDTDHRPSDLHRRLLALPWADVFTTNWDTLLERASPEAHERAYDVVTTPFQIPSAALPRIVKLHGTLPANGPFILTEEDFRTYPRRFAPFVNMVQQAMMETSVVLLGFSGDDPNFLRWSGWVRDTLGEHTPPIYLVGWLALAPQRRRMLEERGVVPIDLSQLPDAREWPDEARHRWAVEWFLHAMEGARPPRLLAWPDRGIAAAPAIHLGWTMPASGADEPSGVWPRLGPDASDEARMTEFRGVMAAWRGERQDYPGWWIAPDLVRTNIWSRTVQWLGDARKRICLLPLPDQLMALAEVLRRLDLCLLDAEVVTGLPDLVENVLAQVSTDGKRWTGNGLDDRLDAAARDNWRVCLLASARLARSNGDRSLHEARLSSFEIAPRAVMAASHEATFERALWHLHYLEDGELDALLDSWKVREADPSWGIRKAGLLAAAGRGSEARSEVVDAIARARRSRRSDAADLPALSREGWGLVLGSVWRWDAIQAEGEADHFGDRDPWGRSEDLRPYGCDGRSDIQALTAVMLEPSEPTGRRRRRGFEPGTVSEYIHFQAGLPDAYQAGRQLMRLADVTALPPIANNTYVLRRALQRAVTACAPFDAAPNLVFLLVRASGPSDGDALQGYLTGARAALLADDAVARLVVALLRRAALSQKRASAGQNQDFWMGRLRVAVESLSRLLQRCSDDQAREAFDLACSLSETGLPPSNPFAGREVRHLFSRTIARLPEADLIAALLRVASLPFPDEKWARTGPGLLDPIGYFESHVLKLKELAARQGGHAEDDLTRTLLSLGRESPFKRRVAIERLYLLDRAGLIHPDGRDRLAGLVWDDPAYAESLLANKIGFFPWVLLKLPELLTGQAASAFRREFLLTKQNRPTGDTLWNIAVCIDETRDDDAPFALSPEENAAVAALALNWAVSVAPVDESAHSPAYGDEELAQEGLARLMVAIRLPDRVIEAIRSKVSAMQVGPARPLAGIRLSGGLAFACPELSSAVVDWLRRGLVSADPIVVSETLRALFLWLDGAKSHAERREPPDDLVEELAVILTARRPETIVTALDFARLVFARGPTRLHQKIAIRCDLALVYLVEEYTYQNEIMAGIETEIDAPLVRRHCVSLATSMDRAGFGDGEGVRRWMKAGASDPLHQVRRAADQGGAS